VIFTDISVFQKDVRLYVACFCRNSRLQLIRVFA